MTFQTKNSILANRLLSLDVLRGFDLFFIVALEGILRPLSRTIDAPWYSDFMWAFTHVEWEGSSPWDLIMPLFMFMAGVSMPFALSRYRDNKAAAYRRILKRVVLLWIFGMICQGNLLGLDPDRIYLYSNTLQSIAAGYLIGAVLYLHTKWYTQVLVCIFFLLFYWAAMTWGSADGFGLGNYAPDVNFAEWVDRVVLGRFRDCSWVENGTVMFAPWYTNTWILSTPNFAVTVITGLLAGQILKNKNFIPTRKTVFLLIVGVGLLVLGYALSAYQPIIKRIWTSTMVLVTSGWCFLLMAAFYYVIDVRGFRRGTGWLNIYGTNSIAAYMLLCVNFSSVSNSLLYGLEQYIPTFYPALIATSNAIIIYQILRLMYRQNIFLKV